jgi:hypothetical protein
MLLGAYAHAYLQAHHDDRRRRTEQWTVAGSHEHQSARRGVVSH